MKKIKINDEYIKLGQVLKLAGWCHSGADAKHLIAEGKVKVNEKEEFQRGKKIRDGDIVEYNGEKLLICG